MFKAVEYFKDLKDNGHKYHPGDTFPREGYAPGAKRIAELASANNKRGRAVIAEVAEKAADEPVEKPEKERAEIPEEPVERKPTKRRGRKKDA